MPYYFYVTNQISKLEWLIMWLLFIEGQMFQDAHSQIKLEKNKVLLKFDLINKKITNQNCSDNLICTIYTLILKIYIKTLQRHFHCF